MRVLALIAFSLTIPVLSACGGSSNSAPLPDEIVWRHGEPDVVIHHGPVPKKLIVEDFREGSGAVLKKGSTGVFKYKEFSYKTGREEENWWEEPFRASFGKGELLAAWETGLKGMRVGGRRALIVPPAQAFNHVPVIYVIELAAVS